MVFFIISLSLAKISLLLFIQRLLAMNSHKLLLANRILIVVSATWALGSILAISINCSPEFYISDEIDEACTGMVRQVPSVMSALGLTFEH